jgi:type III pantothenate kinase
MNLIIDIGNSFVKVAVFKKDALVQKELIQSKDLLKTVKELKKKYKTLNKAIISSVGKVETTIIDVLKESFHVLVLNSQTKLPFKNLYGTPKTLGVDRMALVSASTKQFPKKNVLIVDAGTCITYDFINNKNEYFGGAISPGIRMRYQSLNNFTANLPLLETNLPTDIIGNSTATSIHSGIITGILKEIDGVISEYKEKYPDLTVILTGGDTKFLSKQLKSSIFANSNFLLEGLNHILQFNSN